jgi:hypothetical protein
LLLELRILNELRAHFVELRILKDLAAREGMDVCDSQAMIA